MGEAVWAVLLPATLCVGWTVAGFILWTLVEYAVHRFIFHARPGSSTSKIGPARNHHRHHLDPDTFPTASRRLKLATIGWAAITVATCPAVGLARGGCAAAGFAAGYGVYTVTHQALHQTAPQTKLWGLEIMGLAWWSRYIRAHHLYHHFENAKRNHAVIFPPWDYLFGTAADPRSTKGGRIRVPLEKYPIPWLVGRDGRIHPEFRSDYAART
mmetsp:Transcript_13920/g.41450  ORF Transcript_13920/g.41450 Transcript_13920/m.41450 type:complete len:213 (-) Transcript_13920:271-909(-)